MKEIKTELLNLGHRTVEIHYRNGEVITGLRKNSGLDYLILELSVVEKGQDELHEVNFDEIDYVVITRFQKDPLILRS